MRRALSPRTVHDSAGRIDSHGAKAQGGAALLEWTLASALGIMVTAAAVWLLSHQGQLLHGLIARHAQEQDRHAVMQVLRSELRVAGQRDLAGPSAAHDQLLLDHGRTPSIQYLCDRCGSPDRTRTSGLRVQEGVIAHRSLGATAHQALNDPRVLAVRGWQVTQGQSGDCSPWIRLQLQAGPAFTSTLAAASDTAAAPAWALSIRPRNLGLLSCEADANRMAAPGSTP